MDPIPKSLAKAIERHPEWAREAGLDPPATQSAAQLLVDALEFRVKDFLDIYEGKEDEKDTYDRMLCDELVRVCTFAAVAC